MSATCPKDYIPPLKMAMKQKVKLKSNKHTTGATVSSVVSRSKQRINKRNVLQWEQVLAAVQHTIERETQTPTIKSAVTWYIA